MFRGEMLLMQRELHHFLLWELQGGRAGARHCSGGTVRCQRPPPLPVRALLATFIPQDDEANSWPVLSSETGVERSVPGLTRTAVRGLPRQHFTLAVSLNKLLFIRHNALTRLNFSKEQCHHFVTNKEEKKSFS